MNGKYSKINNVTKDHYTCSFLWKDTVATMSICAQLSFIQNKWFVRYAELLDVTPEFLTSVGELCNTPDLEKENLLIKVADLENIQIIK
jgi:hypothetical protein